MTICYKHVCQMLLLYCCKGFLKFNTAFCTPNWSCSEFDLPSSYIMNMKGSGKAFCSRADVVSLCEFLNEGGVSCSCTATHMQLSVPDSRSS